MCVRQGIERINVPHYQSSHSTSQPITNKLTDHIIVQRKGMYNGSILGVPRRINDEVEERELIRKGLSSLI